MRNSVVRLARRLRNVWAAMGIVAGLSGASRAQAQEVIFEEYSPYHHVQVVDAAGMRTLSFDGTHETRMSLANPDVGHFEYTELFHFAWLWNSKISDVLMLGLGGGSAQRAFLRHYPEAKIQSVEIDPVVLKVATNFFHVPLHDRHQAQIADGRTFLRRSQQKYDLIILDAYTRHRYGSQVPHHLATREFFKLAREHLTPEGVLAYNVITTMRLGGVDAGLALTRTLQEAFPQVYCFEATSSRNVVLIATQEERRLTTGELAARATALTRGGLNPPPGLFQRLGTFQTAPPRRASTAPVLTDDYAPVEALGRRARQP